MNDYCSLLYPAAVQVQNCILCTDSQNYKDNQGDTDPTLKWQTGDVAFLGDTITYLFRGDPRYDPPNSFNPIVPLSVNFGTLGLGTFRLRLMLDRLFSPGPAPDAYSGFGRPSTIVMLAGFNGLDYGLAPCRLPSQYCEQEELCDDVVCGADTLSDGCVGSHDVLERLIQAMQVYQAQDIRMIVQGYHAMANGLDGSALNYHDKAIRDRAIRSLNRRLSDLTTSYGLTAYVPHYADFPPYTSSRQAEFVLPDGIHLTPNGDQLYIQRLLPFLYDRPAFGSSSNLRTISYHGPTKQSGSALNWRVLTYPIDKDRKLTINCTGSATATVFDPLRYNPDNSAIATGTSVEVQNSQLTSSPIVGQSPQVIVKFGYSGTPTLTVDNFPTNDAAVRASAVKDEDNGGLLQGLLTYNAPNGIWYRVLIPAGETLKIYFSDPGGPVPVIKVFKIADTSNALVQNASDSTGRWTVSYHSKTTAQYFVMLRSPDTTRQVNQRLIISWGNQSPGAVTLQPPVGTITQSSPSVASGGSITMAAWIADGHIVVASSQNQGKSWAPASVAYNGTSEPAATSQPLKLVFGNNEWRVIFATAAKIKLVTMPAASSSWSAAQELSDTDVTCSGTTPELPNLIYRPAGASSEWRATWLRNGQEGDGSYCDCCRTEFMRIQPINGSWQNSTTLPINATVIPTEPDLSPYADSKFMTVNFVQAAGTSVSESSMDAFVAKPVTSNPPSLTDDPDLRVLMAGSRQVTRSTAGEIVNPQICWVPRGASGFWLAVWCMQENWLGGEDLDLYYSTAPDSTTTWTQPRHLLPELAKIDREDDYLGDLIADSSGQVHLAWRRGKTNGAIMMAHASPVGGVVNQPASIQCSSPYLVSPNEGLSDNDNPRLSMDGNDLVAVWHRATDGAILAVSHNKSQFNPGGTAACPKALPNDEPYNAQLLEIGEVISGSLTACGTSTCCGVGCDTIPDTWYKVWVPNAGTVVHFIAADPDASGNSATLTVYESTVGESLDATCPFASLVLRATANSTQAYAGKFSAAWTTAAPCWLYVQLKSSSSSDVQLIAAIIGNVGGGVTSAGDWQLYD